MAQKKQQAYEKLLDVVAQFSNGVSVGQLMKTDLGWSRRTLQRRLTELVQTEVLIQTGERRSTTYRLLQSSTEQIGGDEKFSGDSLQMTTEQIRDAVSRDISVRKPVGYNRTFLDAYQPGHSSYLSNRDLQKLERLGKVGMTELPAGTYLRQVMDRLLVDLSWNSSRLEGNTYSLLETKRLLEKSEVASGKEARETQMILNHKAAVELLADQADEIGFNRYTICNLHALLSDNLLADSAASGKVRTREVAISGTVYYPLAVPQLIQEQFALFLRKAEAISNPFEQAFFAMVHLPYLQAFEDVNKRVSRLAANIPLVRKNLCPLSFIDVVYEDYIGALLGVYELNQINFLRDVFVHAYERSCSRYAAIRQSLGEPDPFRLNHRETIFRYVRHVVSHLMNKKDAVEWIEENAHNEIGEDAQQQFIETVQNELFSLHEGNIARYKIRPGEFDAWFPVFSGTRSHYN